MATKPILSVLGGTRIDPAPVWFMRQAGRYLPEYRALRAEKGGFLDLVYDADAAAEVTLQPLRRFAFDAAILFSDILIVPHAMGQELTFTAGEGPVLEPRMDQVPLNSLEAVPERLEAIYRTVTKVKVALPPQATLIGFAGSPWTVATYMVAGEGTKDQSPARLMAYADRAGFTALIDRIVDLTVDYLAGQVEAGAEAVQLFDSWSGSLSTTEFDQWVIAPTRRIVDRLRERCPGIPIIGFPKGAGEKLAPLCKPDRRRRASASTKRMDPDWATRASAVRPSGAGQSRSDGADGRRRRAAGRGRPHPRGLRRQAAYLQSRPRYFQGHPDCACRAGAAGDPRMIGWLGGAYPWVLAAHVIFIIFWMAGLFSAPAGSLSIFAKRRRIPPRR